MMIEKKTSLLMILMFSLFVFFGCTSQIETGQKDAPSSQLETLPQAVELESEGDGENLQQKAPIGENDFDSSNSGNMEKTLTMEKDESHLGMEKVAENSAFDEGKSTSFSYEGTHLGGSHTTPYITLTQKDYERALSEEKTILLYFYASWCPTCRAEQGEVIGAFNELSNKDLIGFRVNYKDPDTDTYESDLAKEYGIAYQHTKIIIKEGKPLKKSLESWKKEQYLEEFGTI